MVSRGKSDRVAVRPARPARSGAAGAFRIGILGTGACLPATAWSNADLARFVPSDDAWVRRRTGIRSRRVLGEDESILGMAVEASRQALAAAGVAPKDVGEVRVATCTWNRLPSLASQVQRALGIAGSAAADVEAGCAGFVYAIEDVWSRMWLERHRYGEGRAALVVGADALSHIADWTDRSTCVLFGDGAGAVVLGDVAAGGILAAHTGADGRHGDLLYTEAGPDGPRPLDGPGRGRRAVQVLRMDGRRVFQAAVDAMVFEVRAVLDRAEAATGRRYGIGDVDLVIPHQANLRIIERVAKRLGVPSGRVYADGIVRYGNTSAASIPLAYADLASRNGALPRPRLELDVAFGAGFASGAVLREVV